MKPASTGAPRALAPIGLAAVAVAAVGAIYLGPGLVRQNAQRPAPTDGKITVVGQPVTRWRLVSASFGDADHGAVTMARTVTTRDGLVIVGPPATAGTYLTSDGGRTWTQHRF